MTDKALSWDLAVQCAKSSEGLFNDLGDAHVQQLQFNPVIMWIEKKINI